MPLTINGGWSIGPGFTATTTAPAVTSVTVCATAAENANAVMTAPAGKVFTSVEFASFGTPTGTCGAFALGACNSANSVSVVSAALIGKSGTINIPATNTNFLGDPCSGTPKSLYIQATATG